MNTTRQDAWTKDEDIILAETVLRYIREGKTQLEAFKEVAERLSRTSAACGFRWNASIRKQYQNAIQSAREERKRGIHTRQLIETNHTNNQFEPLEKAILLLEKLRISSIEEKEVIPNEHLICIQELQRENDALKKKLTRYQDAWREMNKLWAWIEKQE